MPVIETTINGEKIQFELASNALTGELPTSSIGDKISEVQKNISQEMINKIKVIVKLIMEAKDSFDESPQEIAVEFGLSVDAKANVVITSGTIGANITISFKWGV